MSSTWRRCHEFVDTAVDTKNVNLWQIGATRRRKCPKRNSKSRSQLQSSLGKLQKVAGAVLETSSNTRGNDQVSIECGAKSGVAIELTEADLLTLWHRATTEQRAQVFKLLR